MKRMNFPRRKARRRLEAIARQDASTRRAHRDQMTRLEQRGHRQTREYRWLAHAITAAQNLSTPR
jgi:hypothetical protein